MNCCDARSTLPLLLDEQLAAGERAAALDKAMACRLCRAELESMAQNDAALRRALTAQISAVPAGYFEDFWPRLAAKLDTETLEGESMRTSSGSGDPSVSNPPPQGDLGKDVAGKPMSKEEFSGLHEIKALAASAVRRTTEKRAESEPGEGSDALIATPAALSNVVLPQPGKEVAPPKVRAASVADADGVRAAPLSTPVVKHSRAGLYVGAFGILVAAAAIGLYLKNGAVNSAAAPQTVAAIEPAAATPVAAAAARAQEAPPVAAATVPTPGEAGKPEEPAPSAAVAAGARDDDKSAAKDEKSARDKDARAAAKDDKAGAKDKGGAGIAAVAGAKEPNKDKDAKELAAKESPAVAAEATKPTKPEAPKSEIDDIFGDKPKTEARPAAPSGPALPEKLSQDDVKKGMASVKARVQACYDEFKVSGTIKLKVKIEPDGSVSGADVVDQKFSATDTGTCVAAAVKTAKFPAVSGTSLVVSYPFILQ